MRNLLVLLCSVAPIAAFSAAAPPPASSTPAPAAAKSTTNLFDAVVAKGKGVEIKRSELDTEVIANRTAYAARQIPAPPGLDKQALKSLIIKHLILSKATDADKTKGKELFESQLKEFKTANNISDEQFNDKLGMQLKVMGQTKSQWEQNNIEQATIPIVVERELKIEVPESDAKKFYDENPARFEQPEMVRVSHILFMTKNPETEEALPDDKKKEKRKQAEDVLKRARAGEDFMKLAEQYSEDPGFKAGHKEYKFSRDDAYVPQFKDASFALTNGQISELIETMFGYHIIKLHEKIPAKKMAFDEVKKDIERGLKAQAMQSQFLEYAQKLEKDADVQVLDESLKMDEEMLNALKPAAGTNKPAPAPATPKK